MTDNVVKMNDGAASASGVTVGRVELPSYKVDDPWSVRGVSKVIAQTKPADGDSGLDLLSGGRVITPPLDYEALAKVVERSNALRQCVDAYATNIDGFGHRIEPRVDLEADDLDEQIAGMMQIEAVYDGAVAREAGHALEPSAGDVAQRRRDIARRIRFETMWLESWLAGATHDGSTFTQLRKQTRTDLESLGQAAWEVLRSDAGDPVAFVRMPPHQIRVSKQLEPVVVDVPRRITATKIILEEQHRAFRLYAQERDGHLKFFKSFGDDRPISTEGRLFDSPEALAEAGHKPASEVIYFRIPAPRTPYGLPRWLGCLDAVLGSSLAERVNRDYFEHKSVPPLALLIAGAKAMTTEEIEAMETRIAEQIQGVENFHSILILQAPIANAAGAKPAKMELKPLTEAQHDDALFQQYDENTRDKVGQLFRLPRLLRGESKDFNRATADAALRFAEDQVFQPERDAFDDWMNGVILPALGIECLAYRTQTIQIRDPARMAEMVGLLTEKGIITPEEARELAGDVLNRTLRRIDAPWTSLPTTLTLAGVQNGIINPDGTPVVIPGGEGEDGVQLQADDVEALATFVTEKLGEAEDATWDQRVKALRAALASSGIAVVDMGAS